MTQIKGRAF